jgi:hypothetical protein
MLIGELYDPREADPGTGPRYRFRKGVDPKNFLELEFIAPPTWIGSKKTKADEEKRPDEEAGEESSSS